VITQCSIRHLYTLTSIPQPQKDALILRAKSMERRRCNHHTLEHPLSTLECLSSVVDPKESQTNKNRYVVASQEEEVRGHCRAIKGVPLVYVKRSVMVMEPMAESSLGAREGFEKGKFRAGIRNRGANPGEKRKRAEDESTEEEIGDEQGRETVGDDRKVDGTTLAEKKKSKGPKGPNPLSMKKSQKKKEAAKTRGTLGALEEEPMEEQIRPADDVANIVEPIEGQGADLVAKRKRKRKHRPSKLAELLETEAIDEGSS